MRFGKTRMFLLLNGSIAFVLSLYFGTWLLSPETTALIAPPYNANTINIQYEVNGEIYGGSHLRNEIPFYQKQIEIHYFIFDPSYSRINSFLGLYAEPLGWWLVFLLASSMLLLMPNTVFSKGTRFQIQKKFPWISMDEYFPAPGGWFYRPEENHHLAGNQKDLKEIRTTKISFS